MKRSLWIRTVWLQIIKCQRHMNGSFWKSFRLRWRNRRIHPERAEAYFSSRNESADIRSHWSRPHVLSLSTVSWQRTRTWRGSREFTASADGMPEMRQCGSQKNPDDEFLKGVSGTGSSPSSFSLCLTPRLVRIWRSMKQWSPRHLTSIGFTGNGKRYGPRPGAWTCQREDGEA